MSLSAVLACLIVLIFALLGVAKIMALGPMPELAAHAGFTTASYRLIGALELAGAIGAASARSCRCSESWPASAC
ncbi:DoxX family protein [Streptomyces sp. NPDC101237]|uniref:DoxX family protein n=1 Tax=Streptomyces sp. NPDC101237 TaxID=3366139 RepID=UPI003809C731